MIHAAHKIYGITMAISVIFLVTGCTGLYVEPELVVNLARLSDKNEKYIKLSEMQKFYLSGEDSSQIMSGSRLIRSIGKNTIINISRISFTNDVWREYYYDNEVSSKKLNDFFTALDNSNIDIPDYGPKTIQFNATQFRELIENKRTVLTKITIYEEGFIAIYTESDQTIVLIPFGRGNYQLLRECFDHKM